MHGIARRRGSGPLVLLGAAGIRIMKTYALIVCLAVTCLSPASADILILQNGERMVGSVVQKDGDLLIFQSDSMGHVEVDWAAVKKLTTDTPVKVVLVDGKVHESLLTVTAAPAVGDDKHAATNVLFRTPVDIDMISPPPWTLGEGWEFSGKLNTALKYERGNTKKDEIGFDGCLTLRRLHNRFEIAGELGLESNSDEETKDEWVAHGGYNRFLSEQLYGVGYAMGERDKFADIELRAGLGVGAGWQFRDTERVTLRTELMLMRLNEKYDNDNDEEYWGTGWRLVFDRRLFNGFMLFSVEHRGVWDIEQTDKLFGKTLVGLRLPIRRGLTVTLELENDYDKGAAQGTKEEEGTYRVKMGYEW